MPLLKHVKPIKTETVSGAEPQAAVDLERSLINKKFESSVSVAPMELAGVRDDFRRLEKTLIQLQAEWDHPPRASAELTGAIEQVWGLVAKLERSYRVELKRE